MSSNAAATSVFAHSLVIGLSIAAPVGQIGVLAIQRTLQHGRAAGLATGIGAALADALYGAIGAFGVSSLIDWLTGLKTPLTIAGAAFLLWLAAKTAVRAPAPTKRAQASAASLLRCAGSTFVLTLSNPTTVLAFMAVFATVTGGAASASPWSMVAGVLLGSALWWAFLAWGVGLVRERFDARWQRAVNLTSALVLAGFALWQLARLV